MPIQLPLAQPYVNLPPPPQDPPTIGDVMVAQRYHEQVDNLRRLRHGIGGPNQLNAAQAEIYKLEVIQAHRAEHVAPLWFIPVLRAELAPIIRTELAPIRFTVAQTRNAQLDDGSVSAFHILPFMDGSMPNEHPHNLPALTDAAAVRNLTPDQSLRYCDLYGLGNPGRHPVRRAALGRIIGCIVEL